MPTTPENEKAIAAQILCTLISTGHTDSLSLLAAKGERSKPTIEELWKRIMAMVSNSRVEAPL